MNEIRFVNGIVFKKNMWILENDNHLSEVYDGFVLVFYRKNTVSIIQFFYTHDNLRFS